MQQTIRCWESLEWGSVLPSFVKIQLNEQLKCGNTWTYGIPCLRKRSTPRKTGIELTTAPHEILARRFAVVIDASIFVFSVRCVAGNGKAAGQKFLKTVTWFGNANEHNARRLKKTNLTHSALQATVCTMFSELVVRQAASKNTDPPYMCKATKTNFSPFFLYWGSGQVFLSSSIHPVWRTAWPDITARSNSLPACLPQHCAHSDVYWLQLQPTLQTQKRDVVWSGTATCCLNVPWYSHPEHGSSNSCDTPS
jgi:hypothetical protein